MMGKMGLETLRVASRILCLEPEETPGALEWLADAGVQAAIVISAGFREIGGRAVDRKSVV